MGSFGVGFFVCAMEDTQGVVYASLSMHGSSRSAFSFMLYFVHADNLLIGSKSASAMVHVRFLKLMALGLSRSDLVRYEDQACPQRGVRTAEVYMVPCAMGG